MLYFSGIATQSPALLLIARLRRETRLRISGTVNVIAFADLRIFHNGARMDADTTPRQ